MIIGGLLRRLMKKMMDSGQERRSEQEHISRIMEQAKNLEELVGRFERLMPETARRFTTVELNSVVDEAISAVGTEAELKGVELRSEKSPAALTFQGNRQLIKLALIHILRNAIEACRAGDRITISTHLGPAGVHVRVEDTGPGIPGPVLEHIFEPFYETDAGHTGLGLPYVKQIIEEHKGRLKIESRPGSGTAVEIELPTHVGEL
jgi:signal transduction histidine kinase